MKPDDVIMELGIVEHLWLHGPCTTRSNFARQNPELFASAAQSGLVTTKYQKSFGSYWRPTALGLTLLEEYQHNDKYHN